MSIRSLWYKFIALAIALVMIVPILAACGKEKEKTPTTRPTASALSMTGQPKTMYPNITYTVTAAYHDEADGMEDLQYCYLRLNHPTKPLTLMWNQSTDEYWVWAGEEGANYITVTGYTVPVYDSGYELNWQFTIKNTWPEVENAIDFGIFASDQSRETSGWDYDDSNASFHISKPVASFSFYPSDTTTPPRDPYTPVIDEKITFDAYESKPSYRGSSIIEYQWDFGDGSPICTTSNAKREYAYLPTSLTYEVSEKIFVVKLIVKDDKQQIGTTAKVITIKRPPVLLVHGFQVCKRFVLNDDFPFVHIVPDPFDPNDVWNDMTSSLTGNGSSTNISWVNDPLHGDDENFSMNKIVGRGFVTYISQYTHDKQSPSVADIRWYARSLAREIEIIKDTENVNKIDIVAHSTGGLITRAYVENDDLTYNPYATPYRHDIRKVIFLGTPNYGVLVGTFDDIFPIKVLGITLISWDPFASCSPSQISGTDYDTFLQKLNSSGNPGNDNVVYYAIAGDPYNKGIDGKYQGVKVDSVFLEEIPLNRRALVPLAHDDLRTDVISTRQVEYWLRGHEVSYTTPD